MAPTLLVLAAGMGSRYGGLKQLEPVGPGGETMLDFAVFDAARAGFGRVVFVIRRDFEREFRDKVSSKYGGRMGVDHVFQAPGDLPRGSGSPSGREKPWGTGHAVWSAREAVREPFGVINADDFYGQSSYRALAAFLGGASGARFALIGYRLSRTLSENGAVSRGICEVRGGRLASITEERGIEAASVGPGRRLSGEETVSMNLWGFTPSIFEGLEAGLRRFLAASGSDPEAEFYLPSAVSALIAAGEAQVDVIPSADSWFGVTYRGDRAGVEKALASLAARGEYPGSLFS